MIKASRNAAGWHEIRIGVGMDCGATNAVANRRRQRWGATSKRLARAAIAALAWLLASPVSAQGQDASSSDLDFAHGLYARKEYALAAQEYRNHLRKAAAGATADEARFFLAESLVQLKKSAEAIDEYRQLVATGEVDRPHFRMALYRFGELSLAGGENAKAAEALRRFVAEFPRDPLLARARCQLGDAEFLNGRFAEAKAAFALAEESKDARIATTARIGRCRATLRLGFHDEAAKAALDALASDGQANFRLDDATIFELGSILLEAGQAEAANDAFNRMARQFPRSPLSARARLSRGRALDAMAKKAEAKALFQELMDEAAWPAGDSQRADAWLWFGLAQLEERKPESAAITFAQARRLFPRHPRLGEFDFYAAVAAFEAGKWTEASAAFDAMVAAKDSAVNYAPALVNRARVYRARCQLESKDYRAVYRTYSELAEANPEPAALDGVALVAAQAVARDDSLDAEKKTALFGRLASAVQGANARLEIRQFVAEAEFRAGQFDRCKSSLDSLLAEPLPALTATRARHLLGLCELRLKNWEAARAALEGALDAAQTINDQSAPMPAEIASGLATACGVAASHLESGQRAKRLIDRAVRELSRGAKSAEHLLKLANALHAGRKLDDARRIYDRVLQLDVAAESKGDVLLAVAWAEYENGEFVRAAERFGAACQALPAKSPVWFEAKYMNAVATERTLGDDQRSNADPTWRAQQLESIANAYLDVFRSDAAIGVDTTQAARERREDAGFRAARVLARLRRYDDAQRLLNEMDKAGPAASDAKARIAYERAWLMVERGQLAEALAEFTRLLEAHPRAGFVGEAALKASEIAAELKQFDVAERMATVAVERLADRSMKATALLRLGNAAVERRRWDVAQDAFGKLVHADSQAIEAHAASSQGAASLGAKATDKELLAAEFWLAEIEFLRGRTEAALPLFAKLVEKDQAKQWHESSLIRVAQCELAQGHYDKAATLADKFVAAYPKSALLAEAAIIQARSMIRAAKFDDARGKLELATVDKSETAARAQFLIGQTFFHQQRYDEAVKAFLKVEILYPHPKWQAMALLEAGKCYEQKKDAPAAKTIYGRLLEKFPDSDAATAARRLTAQFN